MQLSEYTPLFAYTERNRVVTWQHEGKLIKQGTYPIQSYSMNYIKNNLYNKGRPHPQKLQLRC